MSHTSSHTSLTPSFDESFAMNNYSFSFSPNNTPNPTAGEVIYGNSMMGIKGYFATVTMKTDNTTNNGGPKALFAVSTEIIMK